MSISIQPELENQLRERAEAEGVTLEAYLERLLRAEDMETSHIEALLQEAADSGDYLELDEAEWDRIEREAHQMVDARTKRPA